MGRYLGFRGHSLERAQILMVIMPAYILFGYNNGIGGSLVDLPSWVKQFPRIDTINTTGAKKTNNSHVEGTVVAIYTLGCFFGALSCILLGDKLGRKKTMTLGAAVQTIGVILQITSFSLGQLIVGRLVTGFGFGALSATAPNWQSECSGAEHRGGVVLLEGLFISAGLAIQGWISFGVSFASGSVQWRFPLSLSALWSIIVCCTVQFMPESPRWLIKHGKVEEAREVLAALADETTDSTKVNDDVKEIEESLHLAGEFKFRQLFTNGRERYFHRTCLAACGQLFQQMCGINAIAFYLPTIFEQYLGLTSIDSRILGASVFTFQTVCSPIGVLTVDRFGRRKLMIFAAIGMGCCMTVLAGTVSAPNDRASIIVAGIAIFLFSLFFPTGFLGLTFLYAAEISPLSARVPITAISTGSAWLWNFVVAEITPTGFATIKYRYYIVYATINFFLILPCVYLFWPETSGRHLEEVDEIFIQSQNIFQPVRISKSLPKRRLTATAEGMAEKPVVDEEQPEKNAIESMENGGNNGSHEAETSS